MRWYPAHPLAPPSGLVSEARVVLYGRIGPGEHPCHWCHKPVRWVVGQPGHIPGALIADHVNSIVTDDSPDNLVPACSHCNATRGTNQVLDSEEFVVLASGGRLRVGETRTCRHCGVEFKTTVSCRNYCGKHRHVRYRT